MRVLKNSAPLLRCVEDSRIDAMFPPGRENALVAGKSVVHRRIALWGRQVQGNLNDHSVAAPSAGNSVV